MSVEYGIDVRTMYFHQFGNTIIIKPVDQVNNSFTGELFWLYIPYKYVNHRTI